jgi:hypothetical protein
MRQQGDCLFFKIMYVKSKRTGVTFIKSQCIVKYFDCLSFILDKVCSCLYFFLLYIFSHKLCINLYSNLIQICYFAVFKIKASEGFYWAKMKLSSRLHSILDVLENSFPCLFQLLEVTHVLWLMGPSSLFKASNSESSLLISHDSNLLCCFFSSFKDPYDYRGPTYQKVPGYPTYIKVISNLNSICNFNSPLPCNKTYSNFPWIKMCITLGMGALFC